MQTIVVVTVPAVITAAGTIVAALISRRGRPPGGQPENAGGTGR
ncbi:hypothetical protein ACWEL8_28575 [Streptomyces sp. NPDC004690]